MATQTVDFWISGFLDGRMIWTFGFLVFRFFGFLVFWFSGFLVFCFFLFFGFLVFRFLDFWLKIRFWILGF